MKKIKYLFQERTSWIFVSIGFFILGILILLVESNLGKEFTFWKNFLSNIGAIFLVSGIYTVFSELFIKESLIDLVLKKTNLRKEFEETGVISLGTKLNSINYSILFQDCRKNKIDIMHVYGRTWTNSHKDSIVDYLKKDPNNKINVILANPVNECQNIIALSKKFDITSSVLVERIKEVTSIWESIDMEVKGGKKVENEQRQISIYFTDLLITHSLYRFGELIIFIPSRIDPTKTQNLNTISCVDKNYSDSFFANYSNEIDNVLISSIKQY